MFCIDHSRNPMLQIHPFPTVKEASRSARLVMKSLSNWKEFYITNWVDLNEITILFCSSNRNICGGSFPFCSPLQSEGRVLKEAAYINRSLSFLEQIIIALADPKREHIPFRQSKLTHVLKDSLGKSCGLQQPHIECIKNSVSMSLSALTALRHKHINSEGCVRYHQEVILWFCEVLHCSYRTQWQCPVRLSCTSQGFLKSPALIYPVSSFYNLYSHFLTAQSTGKKYISPSLLSHSVPLYLEL